MHTTTYDAAYCPMTRFFQLIGGKWKPIILYLVQHDINRFGMLARSMPRISKKTLTEQLRELEQDGLITRHVYTSSAPHVIVYRLTEKGISLRKLLDDMFRWGMKYCREENDGETSPGGIPYPHWE